jgi:putative phage-type endonuclease
MTDEQARRLQEVADGLKAQLDLLPEFDADILCEDTTKLPRSEWLEMRRQGLGGSDAAAALGLSPYATPVALYLDKTDPQPEEDKAIYDAGRRAEPAIAKWFADTTGYEVIHYPVMIRSRRHSFMLANPDRFVIDENGEWCVLECKNVDVSKAADWKDGPPLYARIQGLHYLDTCGPLFNRLFIAACIGGNKYVHFEVARDELLIADLIAGEEKFWTMVKLERMPDIDGDKATIAALKAHFSAEEGAEVEVTREFMELLERRAGHKAAMELEKQRLAEVEGRMIVLMGKGEIAKFEDRIVATYKTITKASYVVKAQSYRSWSVKKGEKK